MKKFWMIGLFVFSLVSQVAYSKEIIGTFSNMTIIKEEGDCLGIEVKLWKDGKAVRGELKDYEGECNVTPVALKDVKYDAKTGHISFKAINNQKFIHVFDGTLSKGSLIGFFETNMNGKLTTEKLKISLKKKASAPKPVKR